MATSQGRGPEKRAAMGGPQHTPRPPGSAADPQEGLKSDRETPDSIPAARAAGGQMADSPAFDFVCSKLETLTDLDRLAARGTVRLALKEAGLEARTVSGDQMRVVLDRVLPSELSARGIESSDTLCGDIGTGIVGLASVAEAETPDAVFKRLGGS